MDKFFTVTSRRSRFFSSIEKGSPLFRHFDLVSHANLADLAFMYPYSIPDDILALMKLKCRNDCQTVNGTSEARLHTILL